jgi:hypothetical protein
MFIAVFKMKPVVYNYRRKKGFIKKLGGMNELITAVALQRKVIVEDFPYRYVPKKTSFVL